MRVLQTPDAFAGELLASLPQVEAPEALHAIAQAFALIGAAYEESGTAVPTATRMAVEVLPDD